MTSLFSLAVRWGDAPRPATVASVGSLSTVRTDDVSVVVLGRLLGRDALERHLGIAGDDVSDAELVARTFSSHTLDWLKDACGDFAIVVHDATRDRVLMARNVAGTRPLFFRTTREGLVVASDFAGLGPAGDTLERLADLHSVGRFLAGDAPDPGRTVRADITSPRPSHLLIVDRHGRSETRYWYPDRVPRAAPSSSGAAARALRELLATVVGEVALAQPGPLGVHVTGGLDSAATSAHAVAALRSAGRADPLGFTWQPPRDAHGTPAVDQRLAEDLRRGLGLRLRWQESAQSLMRDCLSLDPLSVPFTSTLHSELATMRTAQDEGVRCIVSGWGGDEFVSYNGRHVGTQTLRARARRAAAAFLAFLGTSDPPADLASTWVREASAPRRWRAFTDARTAQTQMLESGALHARTDSWSAVGQQFGVEYAFPLLDRRVIEFVLSLDDALFPAGRVLMRSSLRGLVPDSVVANTDKSDPSRVTRSLQEMSELAEAVASSGLPSFIDARRRPFVDLVRLESRLADPVLRQPGKLAAALQLLARRPCSAVGAPAAPSLHQP